jgi:catechol-2,3-dioxygenase
MFEKGKKEGIETRGISDHGFIDSIYFRDPNGYVIELTAKKNDSEENKVVKPAPEEVLSRWQSKKVI